ncbi:D-sedoheptulose 7-phosphate isomerase [Tibeticola sediminis]|uniref:Phosphoheptose isomerase n=1 Tax=Tibeticola sediminis TaxID=1917811 RepID=A0A3N4URA3_9BURK|nr:SIS domain-containing protein [Tibeticola sediminis]RPE72558.1 D-sedoheptulose 7-phosphate isomerase [Tibeticola sediminis]
MNAIDAQIASHEATVHALKGLIPTIAATGSALVATLRQGGKVLLCGNGGSAADAQHIAAELVGRFVRARPGLAAIALTTDTSALTAIANDFGYEQVFARQVQALGRSGDVLVAISTSGNSANVIAAVTQAQTLGMKVVGLLGGDGGALAARVDQALIVPSRETARVQECHILIGHIWCQMVDEAAVSEGWTS